MMAEQEMVDWSDLDDRISAPAHYSGDGYHADFAALRAHDPVHWTESDRLPKSYWSITTYADCVTVLGDQHGFSSEYGGVMPLTAEPPTPEQRHALGFGSNPTHLDPPRHGVMRQPFNRHFAAPAIARLRTGIEAAVDAIITQVSPRGECDFVEDIAGPLPALLVCEMMGVPAEDRPQLRHYCAAFMGAQDPQYQVNGGELQTQRENLMAIHDYMSELALSRRDRPTDDFASLVANMTAGGEPMSERDVGWWSFALVVAGLETTRAALSVGFLELLRHPEQLEQLRADPALAPIATEEYVRFTSPGRQKFRIAARDHELRGKRIRKGDWAGCWLSSANRDETVFDEPNRLLVARSPNPHIGFGFGGHSCLGRHLARLEMQIMTNALVARLPDLRLAGDPVGVASLNTSGLKSLPVSFTPC